MRPSSSQGRKEFHASAGRSGSEPIHGSPGAGIGRGVLAAVRVGTFISADHRASASPEYPFWLLRDDGSESNPPYANDPNPDAAQRGPQSSTDELNVDSSVHAARTSSGKWTMGMSAEQLQAKHKMLDDMRKKVESKPVAKRVMYIHDENQRRQVYQKTWGILISSMLTQMAIPEAEAIPDEEVASAKVKELQGVLAANEAKLMDLLQKRPPGTDHKAFRPSLSEGDPKAPLEFQYAYAYGPVGDLPMHTCFLLGLKDLGMKVIKNYYNSPSLISLPYTDDTKFWNTPALRGTEDPRVLDLRRCGQYCDGGLFTGETVLHIAIVQQRDPELVKWMLRRGCNVVARATGAFFKPKLVRRRKVQDDGEEQKVRFGKRVQMMVLDVLQARPVRTADQLNKSRRVQNESSACDYGELPLSFAVSVGSLEICKLLLEHVVNNMGQLKDDREYREFRKRSKEALSAQSIEYEKKTLLRDMKSKWKLEWPELKFGDVLHEEAERVRREMVDLQGKKARFYFMNSCVSNGEGGAARGNTALHMAVLHRQVHLIDWLMENGAKESLGFMNDEDLTPFTLAARQGSIDIFYQFLTKYMRTTAWKYGEVEMSRMSLEQLDSFRMAVDPKDDDSLPEGFQLCDLTTLPLHTGKWRSAIEVIVEHEVEAFANDPLFNKLIDDKWNMFGRAMYLRRTLVPYTFLLALFCVHMFLRCYEINTAWQRWNTDGIVFSDYDDEQPVPFQRIASGTLRPEDPAGIASFFIQLFLVVPCAFPWLIFKGWRQRRLRWRDLDPNRTGSFDLVSFTFKNLSFGLDFLSALFILVGFILRVARQHGAELDCLALTSVLMWSNLLNLIMPFKFFGIMAITTYKMLVGDVIRFLMVFVITTMAFSLATMVLYQKSDNPGEIGGMDVPGTSIISLVWVAVGEVNEYESIVLTRNFGFTIAVHFFYCVLQTILMLNLLIAMMTKTFNLSMDDTHKTWIFPFANLVLRYERLMPPELANLARNRCGEPDRTDTAAMTPVDVKAAHFFIVEVGEDQREKAARDEAAAQRSRHAPIIEKIDARHKEMQKEAARLRARRGAGPGDGSLSARGSVMSGGSTPRTPARWGMDAVEEEDVAGLEERVRDLEGLVARLRERGPAPSPGRSPGRGLRIVPLPAGGRQFAPRPPAGARPLGLGNGQHSHSTSEMPRLPVSPYLGGEGGGQRAV